MMDACRCGAVLDWDAEADRRCRGCGEEIEMADVVDAVLAQVADAFPDVPRDRVRSICDEFIAQMYARADRDTESVLDALTACESSGCRVITALAREHDGRKLCPACYRDARKAEREDERMRATHGPEIAGVRARRAG